MAIFGSGSAQIIYDGTTSSLTNAVMSPTFQIPDVELNKALLTGDKYFNAKGDYQEFEIVDHLFKYASPQAEALDRLRLNHNLVEFYPHNDGKPITSGSNNVLFFVSDVLFGYLNNLYQYDICTIKLQATNYVLMSGSIV